MAEGTGHGTEGAGPRGSRAFGAAALALAALALAVAYGPLLDNAFVMDDVFLIREARGLGDPGALAGMLASPFWKSSSYVAELLHDYWRPVTTLALWLTAFVAGKAPAAFHALSLLGLLAASAALCALLRRLAPGRDRRAPIWLALAFAAHPLAAEIAGMAANVADHLALAFLALQLLALLRHLERGRARDLVAAAAFGALACGSKEIGLVSALSPAAALLLLRATGANVTRRDLLAWGRWAAALAPAALYLALRAWVSARAGWTQTAWPSPGALALSLALGPGLALLGVAAPSPSGAYLHVAGNEPLPWIAAALAWAGLALAAALPIARRRPPGLPALGALAALALLAPSLLGVERLPGEGVLRFPTRYFHLPLAGLLLAALPAAARLWDRGLGLAAPVAIALLCALSWMRADEWQDEVSFFSAEAERHPGSVSDRLNAVKAFLQARAYAPAAGALAAAERLPGAGSPGVRSRVANERAALLVLRDGDLGGAARILERALAAEPADLANVLDLSSVAMLAGEKERALGILERALASPHFRDYRRAAIERRLEEYRAR